MNEDLLTEPNGEHTQRMRVLRNQLLLILSGSYSVVADKGLRLWAQKGSALCFSTTHDITITARQTGRFVKIDLRDLDVPLCLDEKELQGTIFCKTRNIDLADRHPWILEMVFYEQNRIRTSSSLSHIFRSLLLNILYQSIVPKNNSKPQYSLRLDIDKIDSFIANNINNKILVEDLAALCNMSTSRFYAHFRSHLNTTPYRYILNRRIERSLLLLKTTSLPLNEIASMSGFSSRASLNKYIGQVFGYTPCQLRVKLKKNHYGTLGFSRLNNRNTGTHCLDFIIS